MKTIILIIALAVGSMFLPQSAVSATGNRMQYATITSTGQQAITFNPRVEEVYIIRSSTDALYVNYTGILCSNTTNYELIPADTSGPVKIREDVQTNKMSIFSLNNAVNVQIRGKSW